MENDFLWGNAMPVAVFIASVGLLFFALRRRWPVELPPASPTNNPPENVPAMEPGSIRERIKTFVLRYRWELVLGASVGSILLFALIFAPPRLTGEIAIQPNMPGRPFYNLRWVRTFLSTYYDTLWVWSSAFLSLTCIVLLAWVIAKRSGFGAQFALLWASLNLAGVGQWLLHLEGYQDTGRTFYLVAMYGFGMWAWLARKRLAKDLYEDPERKPVKRRLDVLFVLGLLLLASFTRLYTLRTIPYGIEGDEAKWTSEAVTLGVRAVPDSSGEYHRDALPVSYYLQMPLHRLLGPSLFAARLTVVLLSILATLIFYWFLRQVTVLPLAALAAYLLSISVFDISASRLANVESFVKLWPILGLALLALAVHMRRWQVYGLSGLAIALGMLTYDTVWPLLGVVLTVAFIELARQKENRRAADSAIAALIAPALLTLPVIIPYLASRLPYYEFEEKGLHNETGSTIAQYFNNVIHSWFVALRSDFLYNRPGPLLNALLLPLLVLGVVTALILVKKRISYWALLWVGLVIFPVPILNNSPLGRIYYPALPAVYMLVALGIYFFWKETDRLLGPGLRPLWIAVSLVPLVWLPFANLFIYFNEVSDGQDRQMRREIGEFAAQAAGEGTLILLPAIPGKDTALNNEYQMLELYMLQKIPSSEIGKAYTYLAPEELLSRIENEAVNDKKIEVIFDHTETGTLDETLKLCYPHGTLTEGRYFSRFSLSNPATSGIHCSLATLQIEVEAGSKLNWELSEGKTQKLQTTCEVRQTDFQWFETEYLSMGHGWQTEIDFAPGWSGTGFAMDNYGSGPLSLQIYMERPQEHFIWIRYYNRAIDENQLYLNVNNVPYPFAEAQEDGLYLWKWERIGPVDLGIHNEISISRAYADDPGRFMAIFIDSLVITSDPDFSPDIDLWGSIPAMTYTLKQPQSSGTVDLELPPNSYRCKASVESELPVVDVFGNASPFVVSNTIEFDVR